MYFSVQCREEARFAPLADVRARASHLPPPIVDYTVSSIIAVDYAVCESWQIEGSDPGDNEPVVSDVPALIVAGANDPITPAHWGRNAASRLENAYFLELPDRSHGVMRSSRCAVETGLQFLDNPTAEPIGWCRD